MKIKKHKKKRIGKGLKIKQISLPEINLLGFLRRNKLEFIIFLSSFLFYFRTVFFEIPYTLESAISSFMWFSESGSTLNIFKVFFNPNEYGLSPVGFLLIWAQSLLFGVKPYVFHVVNVLLFSICSVFIFNFLKNFFTEIIAFIAVLFFVSHPFMAEPVAAIDGGVVFLSVIFFILSFNMFFFGRGDYSLALSCFCFYMSLLASFYGMFLPFLIVAYGVYFKEGFSYKKVWPHFAVLALYITYTYVLGLYPFTLGYVIGDALPGEYVMTSLYAALFYCFKFFYPLGLYPYYYPVVVSNPLGFEFIISVQFLMLLVFGVFVFLKYDKRVSFAFILIILSLFPVSHIFPQYYFISFTMSVYIVIGLVAVIGCLLEFIIKTVPVEKHQTVYVLIFLPLIFLSYSAFERVSLWHDNVTLLENSVVNFPMDYDIRHKLGQAYEREGELRRALFEYEKSVQLNIRYANGFYDVARLYALGGDMDTSLSALKWAVANGLSNKERVYSEKAFTVFKENNRFEEIEKLISEGINH